MKKMLLTLMIGLMSWMPAYAQTKADSAPTAKTEKKHGHKNKKVKPLTTEEKNKLDDMQQTSTPPTGTNPEKAEVK